MTIRWGLTSLLGLFLFCNATKVTAAEFTYHGVNFGMTKEEVSKLVPLEAGSNRATGRKSFADKEVNFEFDDKGQLYVIEISYWIPKPPHIMRPAMRRALQKKYAVSNPSDPVWDLGDVLMKFEEYYGGGGGKLPYLRTTITHKRLYDEYLDRMAAQLGPSVQD